MPRIRKGARGLTREKTQRARRMRLQSGMSEEIIWEMLRHAKTGFKFRRQHLIASYTLDFCCAEAKVCVEVDGEIHALRTDQDSRRDEFLAALGVMTIRVPSLDLFDDRHILVTQWVTQIVNECERRSGRRAYEDRM